MLFATILLDASIIDIKYMNSPQDIKDIFSYFLKKT